MVSKRQKLARKRFREANPDLFPMPQTPKDPSSSKARKKKDREEKLKIRRKTLTKHPLRVPGMRPGESCFICKSNDHIAKLCPEKSMWEKNKICLLCRQRGHSLKSCPEKGDTLDKKFCYNCGEIGHALSKCPLPLQNGGTIFANCFICKERGHLSKNCPKNTNGIYPKGGSCKICGEVTHLAKDCPSKDNRNSLSSTGLEYTSRGSWRGQRTTIRSGDDLEDDFTTEDAKSSKKDAVSASNPEAATGTIVGVEIEKKVSVKPKKEQGPKVVNFLG